MSNVLINGRTAVHAGSGGILNTVDVCMTKVGPSTVPIPYANIAVSEDAAGTAGTVFIDGHPVCTAASTFASSVGDEAGDKGGVSSGDIEGAAEFITSSADVFIEGEAAVRMGDNMISNDGNTAPAPLMQPGGPMPAEVRAQAVNDTEVINASQLDHATSHAIQGSAMMQNSYARATEASDE